MTTRTERIGGKCPGCGGTNVSAAVDCECWGCGDCTVEVECAAHRDLALRLRGVRFDDPEPRPDRRRYET